MATLFYLKPSQGSNDNEDDSVEKLFLKEGQ